MGWAFLPPVQRTLATPISTVTRPTEFPHQLPAWRNPSFTESLSHLVTDSAPSGVISSDDSPVGPVGPTTSAGARPEMTLLPPPPPTGVQRSIQRQVTPLTGAPHADLPVVHRAVVDEPLPSASAPAHEAEVGAEAEFAAAPDAASVTPEAPTLAEAADLAVGPSAVPKSTTTSDAESGPTLRYDAPSTPAAPAMPASMPPSMPLQRSADPGAATSEPASPRPHRTGLGEPLAALPPSAVPEPPPLVLRSAIESAPSPNSPASPTSPTSPASSAAPPEPSAAAEPSAPSESSPPGSGPEIGAPEAAAAEPEAVAAAEPSQDSEPAPDAQAAPPTAQRLTEPTAVIESPRSWTSTPLPLATPVSTSIQRSSVLPGPGLPQPSLTVRPTPLFPAPPGPRAVPVQRVPAGVPLNPSPARAAAAAAAAPVQRSATSIPSLPTASAGSAVAGTVPGGGGGPIESAPGGYDALPLTDPAAAAPAAEPDLRSDQPVVSRMIDSSGPSPSAGPDASTPSSSPVAVEPPRRTFVQRLFGLPSLPSAPRIPQLPGAPSMPSMPTMPSLPSVPSMPSMPTMPGLPGAPSMSDLPGLPDLPAMPELPSVPDLPGVSDLPGMPAMPELPVVPDLPSVPGASGLTMPGLPSVPDVPSLPGLSDLPGLPGAPSMPSLPGSLPSMPTLPSMPLAMPSLPDVPDAGSALSSFPGLAGAAGALPGLGGPSEVARGATEVDVPGSGGAAPSGSAAGGAAAAGGAGADATTPEQIEALAGKLLTPMLRRIKSELLLDRERHGLRTDSW